MSPTATPEAVALSFSSQCDRGKVRAENQDSVRQAATPLGDLLIVADGIGGYEGGGVASRMAVDAISAALDGTPAFFPLEIAIEEAVCRANAEIIAAAAEPDTPNNRMGSTVVLAILKQDHENAQAPVQAWIGHVGDSRAYLLHRRQLTRVTRDHSAVQLLLDHDLIAPEQARNHPDASVLTRTLGHEPNLKVDIQAIELEPGDSLLLCSDGLWGYVSDEKIERVLADPGLTTDQASRALLDLALDAGGHDNVGIQLARVTGSTAAAPAEPAPAFEASPAREPQPEPELVLDYLLTSRPPDPPAESLSQPEIAPLAPSEAAPAAVSAAPPATLPVPEPAAASEVLTVFAAAPASASVAETDSAPQASAAAEIEPALPLEPAPQEQLLEVEVPEMQSPEIVVQESEAPEIRTHADPVPENQFPQLELEPELEPEAAAVEPVFALAVNPESVLAPQILEPRSKTILGIVAELWELFVHPLGRDFDFAPEWHIVFASANETFRNEEAPRKMPLPAISTLLATVLVTCSGAPRRAIEGLPRQNPNQNLDRSLDPNFEQTLDQNLALSARFKSAANEVSMLLKFLGILMLAFCTSCGLVYCALFENWFGIDYFLHLR
jgi:PPM family protein phosphatase